MQEMHHAHFCHTLTKCGPLLCHGLVTDLGKKYSAIFQANAITCPQLSCIHSVIPCSYSLAGPVYSGCSWCEDGPCSKAPRYSVEWAKNGCPNIDITHYQPNHKCMFYAVPGIDSNREYILAAKASRATVLRKKLYQVRLTHLTSHGQCILLVPTGRILQYCFLLRPLLPPGFKVIASHGNQAEMIAHAS